VIAEVKRRSPAAGRLLPPRAKARGLAARLGRSYAAAGAAAVSIVTEPDAFEGSLADLREAAAAVARPVLRKDFLVDPYQIFEARAAGGAGVLLILRLLDDARLREMLDAAGEADAFVLLEAFDRDDLDRARPALGAAARLGVPALVGLNCRDLASLRARPARFEALRAALPEGGIAVAESAVGGPAWAARVARLGYRAALVGSALLRARDPGAFAAALLGAGRRARRMSCGSA
jgi:indole-3-glycerol phosphate synthase